MSYPRLIFDHTEVTFALFIILIFYTLCSYFTMQHRFSGFASLHSITNITWSKANLLSSPRSVVECVTWDPRLCVFLILVGVRQFTVIISTNRVAGLVSIRFVQMFEVCESQKTTLAFIAMVKNQITVLDLYLQRLYCLLPGESSNLGFYSTIVFIFWNHVRKRRSTAQRDLKYNERRLTIPEVSVPRTESVSFSYLLLVILNLCFTPMYSYAALYPPLFYHLFAQISAIIQVGRKCAITGQFNPYVVIALFSPVPTVIFSMRNSHV